MAASGAPSPTPSSSAPRRRSSPRAPEPPRLLPEGRNLLEIAPRRGKLDEAVGELRDQRGIEHHDGARRTALLRPQGSEKVARHGEIVDRSQPVLHRAERRKIAFDASTLEERGE